MNTLEELYNQAAKGDSLAFTILKSKAETGNPFAQYYLFCVFDKSDTPFYDVPLAMFWLKKSAENGNPVALIKIACFTEEIRNKYELNSLNNKRNEYKPNFTWHGDEKPNPSPSLSHQAYFDQTLYHHKGWGSNFFEYLGRAILIGGAISLLRLCAGGNLEFS